MPDTRLAVDTNFLLDLARQREVAHDALEILRRRLRSTQVVAVPRVCKELAHKMLNDPDPKQRADARKAMSGMLAWGVRPIDLSDVQADLAEIIANKLRDQGIIQWEERHDALILAEAAMLDCQVLVSSDAHLTQADPGRLALALRACGVSVVVVLSSRDIVRKFAGR